MAKDKITDYSATNASNTDLGGIDIQGTGYISNGDNAFREIMTHLAETNAGTYPVADTWSFADPADLTKIARLDCGSITTATTRVITVPDRNGVLMTGPSSTTDNTVPRFNGTAGDIQTSDVVVSDGGLILANSGTAANPAYSFNSGSGTDGMYLKTGSSLGWAVDGVEAMYLTSSSLFPPAQIQIASGSAASPAYTFTSGSGTDGMYLRTSTSLGFSIDGSEVGYMSSSGWVGPLYADLTSATVPTVTVDRSNNTANSFMSFKTTSGAVAVGQGTAGEFAVGATGTALTSTKWFGASASYFYFGNQSNNTPGISNTNTGATMDVVSGYKFRISTTSGTNLSLNVNTNPSDAIDFRYQGTVKGTITVTSTNTAYNTTSDYRLEWKQGYQALEGSGAFIDGLKPYYFPLAERAGFIAHEFAEVSPASVTGEKDATEEDGSPKYQMIHSSSDDVIAHLVAEMQSLRKRIAALEAA